MTQTILVVDDDRAFRELIVEIISSEGYRVLEADNAETALDRLSSTEVDLVLTDQRMPGMDGVELARRVRTSAHPPEVVVMTAYGTIAQAVEAMQSGVADYLTKPLESPSALRRLVRRVLGERNEIPPPSGDFLTRAPRVLEMLSVLDRAAVTDATILITGESGTGKELLARRVHGLSPRSTGPFVAVNCAALPGGLAESELFGHEKGAFTGADRRRPGRFELANGGTLFLDEVGELSEEIQAKLLRAIEGRTIERVGGGAPVELDIRLLAATNRDLDRLVKKGRFRSDLYYRLKVIEVDLPPLRERPSDIALLAEALIAQIAQRLGLEAKELGADAVAALELGSWPGNVRELRNVLERALIVATGEAITARDLPTLETVPSTKERVSEPAQAGPLSLEERERQAILDALKQCDGHRERAAKALGVSVRTLYNRLKQYGIH
jgi:DNA-binding NtrC family response regulator